MRSMEQEAAFNQDYRAERERVGKLTTEELYAELNLVGVDIQEGGATELAIQRELEQRTDGLGNVR